MDTNDKLYNYMISNSFYRDNTDPTNVHSKKALKQDMIASKKYNSAGVYLWTLVMFILIIVLLSINMTI
jgi:hypothetical protein